MHTLRGSTPSLCTHRSPSAQSPSPEHSCRHASRSQEKWAGQVPLPLQLTGVRTQPCCGSGNPFRGIPEKPGGQVQIEEESTEAQLAFGPQASRIAHGSYLASLSCVLGRRLFFVFWSFLSRISSRSSKLISREELRSSSKYSMSSKLIVTVGSVDERALKFGVGVAVGRKRVLLLSFLLSFSTLLTLLTLLATLSLCQTVVTS